MNPGDRVKVKPGVNAAASTGVVKQTREGWKGGRPRVEVEVEFQGDGWWFPYRAWFTPDEVEVLGHGDALP